MKINKIKSKYKKGFTLVETLVAISILSISITATFTAVQNGIQNSTLAKDQTTAFYLAQEAMEFIKNKRDENALNAIKETQSVGSPSTKWLAGMSDVSDDPCYFGKVCRIDSTAKTIYSCGNDFNTCPNLKQNSSNGLFGYISGWGDTIFKREIKFREIVANREIEVTIRMSWSSRWGTKTFEVTEVLFNRQGN